MVCGARGRKSTHGSGDGSYIIYMITSLMNKIIATSMVIDYASRTVMMWFCQSGFSFFFVHRYTYSRVLIFTLYYYVVILK